MKIYLLRVNCEGITWAECVSGVLFIKDEAWSYFQCMLTVSVDPELVYTKLTWVVVHVWNLSTPQYPILTLSLLFQNGETIEFNAIPTETWPRPHLLRPRPVPSTAAPAPSFIFSFSILSPCVHFAISCPERTNLDVCKCLREAVPALFYLDVRMNRRVTRKLFLNVI